MKILERKGLGRHFQFNRYAVWGSDIFQKNDPTNKSKIAIWSTSQFNTEVAEFSSSDF